jgi:hypothetical protein
LEKKYARCDVGDQPTGRLHGGENGKANHRFALLFRAFLRNVPEAFRVCSRFKIAAAGVADPTCQQVGSGTYLDLTDLDIELIEFRTEDRAAQTGWRLSNGLNWN